MRTTNLFNASVNPTPSSAAARQDELIQVTQEVNKPRTLNARMLYPTDLACSAITSFAKVGELLFFLLAEGAQRLHTMSDCVATRHFGQICPLHLKHLNLGSEHLCAVKITIGATLRRRRSQFYPETGTCGQMQNINGRARLKVILKQ
jgi:hypothetical protein